MQFSIDPADPGQQDIVPVQRDIQLLFGIQHPHGLRRPYETFIVTGYKAFLCFPVLPEDIRQIHAIIPVELYKIHSQGHFPFLRLNLFRMLHFADIYRFMFFLIRISGRYIIPVPVNGHRKGCFHHIIRPDGIDYTRE